MGMCFFTHIQFSSAGIQQAMRVFQVNMINGKSEKVVQSLGKVVIIMIIMKFKLGKERSCWDMVLRCWRLYSNC